MTPDELYEAYKKDRVRLRCTNKECELATGWWTASAFVEEYLTKLDCIECGSKHAYALKEVTDE